jgi:hypothetical protein
MPPPSVATLPSAPTPLRATALPERRAPIPLSVLAPRRIAVFRALQLGDLLCAVPALRALRQALPEAAITLVGLPWASDFVRRFGRYLDGHLAFPGSPGLPEQEPDRAAWPGFVRAARGRRFDLAIQLHGDGRLSQAVVAQFGARVTAGFTPGRGEPWRLPYPEHGPEPLRLLALMRFLGAGSADPRLEFPLQAADRVPWAAYPAVHRLAPGGYVCLHPGARDARRRWPAACFAAVGDALARETGLAVVLSGSAPEAPLAATVAQAMRASAIPAAAPVPLGALAALFADCRLLVTNDTGASHLAAALGVPSVVVFRASDPARWAPLDRTRHRVVRDAAGTRAGEVLRQARELLALSGPR